MNILVTITHEMHNVLLMLLKLLKYNKANCYLYPGTTTYNQKRTAYSLKYYIYAI